MTRKAIIWLASVAAIVVGLMVGGALISNSSLQASLNSQSTQVTELRAQVRALERALGNHRVTELQSEITSLQAKLHPGLANDVITCGDLQNMGLQWDTGVTVDNQGNVNLNTQPVPLPNHCVKA